MGELKRPEDMIPIESIIKTAARLPGVRIRRSDFLTDTLKPFFPEDVVSRAVAVNPAYAGIPVKKIRISAAECIAYETAKVTALSFAAGLPGGLALAGTMSADLIQYFGHILRIAQKLIYLYGWQELFDENGEMDDATLNLLTLFLGVMFDIKGAAEGVEKISLSTARKAKRPLAAQQLTKGAMSPLVQKVAGALAAKLTKDVLAKTVSKTIPLLGGVASGGLTYATYRPMARRLDRHLSGLKFTDPGFYTGSGSDVIEIDDFAELD